MAFADQYSDNVEALAWPKTFKIYPNRETKLNFTGLGDFTGVTFECQVRQDSSSTTALIDVTVTTSTDDGGTVSINIDDSDTRNLIGLGSRLYVVLDAIIATDRYPFYAGWVKSEPFGSGLPVEVSQVEFADMLAQLQAIQAAAEAAQAAAEVAQAAAEAAVVGDLALNALTDVTATATDKHALMGNGTAFVTRALVAADISDLPSVPTLTSDLTNDSGFITGYTVTSGDVTAHEADLTILKSQITSFSDADYATAAQGTLADSATQPGDNISTLTNDSGFITSYTVTESDVTTALDGATLTDAGTPASDDKILLQDTSAANGLKYASFSEFGGGGGVDWTTTQTSATADGASNTAFKLLADVDYSLGNVLEVGDAGNGSLLELDGAGNLNFAGDLSIPNSGTRSLYFSSTRPTVRLTSGLQGIAAYGNGGAQAELGGPTFANTVTNLWSGGLGFASGTIDPLIQANSRNSLADAGTFTIKGKDLTDGGVSQSSNVKGGNLALSGGDAAPSATNADGGDLLLTGGTGSGTGSDGDVILSAKDSVPSSLSNSQLSFTLDEVNDKLIVTAKYSDGTDKTFEVAANP